MKLSDFFQGRSKKQRAEKQIYSHQTDIEYLKDVVQIPDEAVRQLHKGREPSPEMELACDLTIEVAKEQIKRVAPARYGVRLPKVLRVSRRRLGDEMA